MDKKIMLTLFILAQGCHIYQEKFPGYEKFIGHYIDLDEDHLKAVATGKRVFDGDPEPKWPGEENDKTIEGIDSDNDGLRDDVEIYINEYIKEREHRLAYKQYARDQLRLIENLDKDSSVVKNLASKISDSRACLFYVINPGYPENEEDKSWKEIRDKHMRMIYGMIVGHGMRHELMKKNDYKLGGIIPDGKRHTLKLGENYKLCAFEVKRKILWKWQLKSK